MSVKYSSKLIPKFIWKLQSGENSDAYDEDIKKAYSEMDQSIGIDETNTIQLKLFV